jgi:putative transposase
MRAHQAEFPIKAMCRLLGVSTSGYYAWASRTPSARDLEDQQLLEHIRAIHKRSRGTYGVPRIHAELKGLGVRISGKRIARLMRQDGIKGVSRRRKPVTTVRKPADKIARDLVDRDFSATAPNRLWVADITFIPTLAGVLYLGVVLDVFSRRVVGWAMAAHMKTELVLSALEMALGQRNVDNVIHHSDQGSQYTSLAFGLRCKKAGIRPSMGSVGDCYDNALCESFFATLECELIDRVTFKNHTDAEMQIFDFIEGWYNPHRRHSALGYLSPMNYEYRYLTQTKKPNHKLSTKTG